MQLDSPTLRLTLAAGQLFGVGFAGLQSANAHDTRASGIKITWGTNIYHHDLKGQPQTRWKLANRMQAMRDKCDKPLNDRKETIGCVGAWLTAAYAFSEYSYWGFESTGQRRSMQVVKSDCMEPLEEFNRRPSVKLEQAVVDTAAIVGNCINALHRRQYFTSSLHRRDFPFNGLDVREYDTISPFVSFDRVIRGMAELEHTRRELIALPSSAYAQPAKKI